MKGHGVVVIGRNEGERLHRCLNALRGIALPVVYVDSASHDQSAAWARAQGVDVLELDPSRPMSAARARNEGFAHLLSLHPELEFVQFIDGDCELVSGWLERAVDSLSAQPGIGAVCGRIRERDPDASVYNLLCNLEWQKVPGYIQACGGNFMVKVEAFRVVGGFNPSVMAAEDDELCVRLRSQGWKILYVDADMVWHDAALLSFRQWWTRTRRAGMAYAQGAAMHGNGADKHFRRECRSILFWGLTLPSASLLLAPATLGLSLSGYVGYPALVLRIYKYCRKRGWSQREAILYAFFTVLGKSPETLGMLQYYYRTRIQKSAPTLIEHKG